MMKEYEVLTTFGPVLVKANSVKIKDDGRLDFLKKENDESYICASFAVGHWQFLLCVDGDGYAIGEYKQNSKGEDK